MKIKTLDHLVLTVRDINESINFYVNVLNMDLRMLNNECSLFYADKKINLHKRPGELQPCAKYPVPGSTDLCFEVESENPSETMENKINDLKNYINKKGILIEQGPVERVGSKGPMKSIYIRDPDENLIELSIYYN
ncbi:VOC family protein (plasmid) [Clostridium botulinum]|uniref:Glyoxalase n=1 Tax=Clostridium botulinum C/D str. DC5 TaxID=1443128 RepID=A0A0A0HUR5_CLOBO|nr:VOC family protein [Clostridium botulinum]KEI00016.1 glyoxalase [Clostridium botulinum C/D str. BKT75002]KEI05822.1 glyoxalase [Clostridium botulinum C/D str. BKT2873]KGM92939.1 glyoxalase [Clostridium botulinum C/D str. DC5]KOC53747.1 glyoxalase [Clostridium botulinum]KOC54249.1 glyoxalase [Clostridium botulinum]